MNSCKKVNQNINSVKVKRYVKIKFTVINFIGKLALKNVCNVILKHRKLKNMNFLKMTGNPKIILAVPEPSKYNWKLPEHCQKPVQVS